MTDPVVEFSHVRIAFGELVVHKDVSFSVERGESLTILGPSGTGKTVLLKLLVGLLHPTSGSVSVFGDRVQEMDSDQLVELRRRVGMLFQGGALFDSLSVYENIAYSLRERDTYSEEEIDEIVFEKLRLVRLEEASNKYPPELSGGQKKRIGLARALASSPEIMLFDEPTTGLDPTSVRRIDELIVELREEFGMTCISVTHDIESARRISDRWLLLADGKVAAHGPVSVLLEENKNVIDFVEGRWSK